ncbi:hypothetical protein [Helicobacter saguini]|nr:hypothetical protein [Helicobacter saguini]
MGGCSPLPCGGGLGGWVTARNCFSNFEAIHNHSKGWWVGDRI